MLYIYFHIPIDKRVLIVFICMLWLAQMPFPLAGVVKQYYQDDTAASELQFTDSVIWNWHSASLFTGSHVVSIALGQRRTRKLLKVKEDMC